TMTNVKTIMFTALLALMIAVPVSAQTIMTKDLIVTVESDSPLFGNLFAVDAENSNEFILDPSSFFALAAGPMSVDSALQSVTLSIKVKDDSDFVLPGITVKESGDYGIGVPTGGEGSVFANQRIAALNLGNISSSNMFFSDTPAGGEEALPEWSVESTLEFEPVSYLLLEVQNLLVAENVESGTTLIDKKLIEFAPVPLPATVWLFGSVLAALGLFRRNSIK
ncbi:MAG: PEP-CTERM sorting domain-containing protein, partial [Pseudomonadota bacterium]